MLRPLAEALARRRTPIGLATALAGFWGLLFPAHGPTILGSLVPAVLGVAVGLGLALHTLVDTPIARRLRKPFLVVGNARIYVRAPLGLAAAAAGLFHVVAPASPFF